jgi:hypothetical protein
MKPFVHRPSALAFTVNGAFHGRPDALHPLARHWPSLFAPATASPGPTQLLERFINANCESCWADPATPKAAAGQLALDWVLPGDKGDDAPLSAVAAREALDRLAALRQGLPAQTLASTLAGPGSKAPPCA